MTNRIFVTGDRSAHGTLAGVLAGAEVHKLLRDNPHVEIVTGDQPGIETAVKAFCDLAGIPVQVLDTQFLEGTLRPDFTARATFLAEQGLGAVVIHPDPMSSRIYTSLAQALPEDNLTLVTPGL